MRIGGPHLHQSGSPAAPGIAFAADPDTGFYWALPEGIYAAVAGAVRLNILAAAISAVVQFLLSDGAAAAPAVAFSNDPDTGLYRIGPDILGISTGGVERARIEAGATPRASFAARVSIPDGTQALPSLAGVNDGTTGLRIDPALSELWVVSFSADIGRWTWGVNNSPEGLQIPRVGGSLRPNLMVGPSAGAAHSGIFSAVAGVLVIEANGVDRLQVDADATADNTPLVVRDITAAAMKRVSRGAIDSGGAGFRVLRIPN